MPMRTYCSETDYPIVREAVFSVGKAGGFLTATKNLLAIANIAWPVNFNSSKSPEALAIDRDLQRALDELVTNRVTTE